MINKILGNVKTFLTILHENPKMVFFILVMSGLTGGNAYIAWIPPHPHPEQKPTTIINKTIINKLECDKKCKKAMLGIAKQVMHDHDSKGHTF